MRHYSSFTVRILVSDDDSMVEGQVSHAATVKTIYFRDFSKAVAFIRDHLALKPDDAQKTGLNGSTVVPGREEGDADQD